MKRLGFSEKGQALVEMALVFPLHVLLILGIFQIGLLSAGRAFTQYGAYAAARAALVEEEPGAVRAGRRVDPKAAAEIALLAAVGKTLPGGWRLPAAPLARFLGRVSAVKTLADPARLAACRAKTRTTWRHEPGRVAAEVEHDFELIIPGVNRLFVFGWSAWGAIGKSRWGSLSFPSMPPDPEAALLSARYGAPHIPLRAECVLPR